MTTTTTSVRVPTPRTPDHDTLPVPRPRTAVTSLIDPALATRALRSGTRLAADALTGVALDDPCCAVRQRELVRWTAGVVAEVRAHAGLRRRGGDAAFDAVLARADRALALFTREVSSGAPVLALALADLADLVEARLDALVGPLPAVARRSARQAVFALPWLLDACHPTERTAVLRYACWTDRLALQVGEARYARMRDAVLGCAR